MIIEKALLKKSNETVKYGNIRPYRNGIKNSTAFVLFDEVANSISIIEIRSFYFQQNNLDLDKLYLFLHSSAAFLV